MKARTLLAMLLLAAVCVGFVSTVAIAAVPAGLVLAEDDGDLGDGPAELVPALYAAEDEPEDGPAE